MTSCTRHEQIGRMTQVLLLHSFLSFQVCLEVEHQIEQEQEQEQDNQTLMEYLPTPLMRYFIAATNHYALSKTITSD